ncbi:MAG: hypothetical protein AABY18_07245 [Candidatus Thermoplasmatota archaeon]
MLAHRPLVALGLLALVLGEGAFFEWDYAEMLGGDPILLVILLAAVTLVVLSFLRPARGLLLAAGITVSLIPAIVLFAFGTIVALADPGGDTQEFLGALLFLAAIGLALPAAILGFRQEKAAAA